MSTSTRFCGTCGARFSNDVRFCPHDGEPLELLPEDTQTEVDPVVGSVIDGRYRVEAVLGEGGMGVVYLVQHVVLNRSMALKLLRGDIAKDADVVERFMREAQAATAIGHANIVDIHDFGQLTDGSPYFVMELLEGESLTARIRERPLSVNEVVPIAEQIASALSAAHQRGVIHRDLKPDNIQLIRRGGNPSFVKVLDFGVAKVGGASSKLTRTGMVFGTPHYISPEQAAGQSVDPRTDVYALGVIIYEMCTGQVPFDGDTFMGILSKHMFEEPPRPTEIQTDAGPLEPIVLKALAKRPEDRYASMDALLADLARIREGGSVAMPTAVAPPTGFAPAYDAPLPEVPSSKVPLVVLAILFLLLVLGGIGGAWMALSQREAQQARNATTTPISAREPIEPIEPVEPVEPDVQAPELPVAEATPPTTVRVESEPVGAAVLVDDAVIGNTPVDVPRPDEGELLVEVRMRGFESRRVSLSPATRERISISLERRRGRSMTSSSSTSRMSMSTTSSVPMMTMVSMPSEPTMMAAPTFMTEVVDPWAD